MMELITKEKFYKLMKEYSEYIFWWKYEDISENLLQILKEDIYKNENSYDILTPFKEGGKDWLLKYVYKYQPRTGKILKENSKLFGGVDLDTKLEYTEKGELGNSSVIIIKTKTEEILTTPDIRSMWRGVYISRFPECRNEPDGIHRWADRNTRNRNNKIWNSKKGV